MPVAGKQLSEKRQALLFDYFLKMVAVEVSISSGSLFQLGALASCLTRRL